MKRIIITCVAGLLFIGCRSKEYDRDDQNLGERRDVPGAYERDTQVAVTDPVCGMHVAPAGAPTSTHDGKIYSFCSIECQQKFQNDPTVYAESTVADDEAEIEREVD